MKNSEYIDKYKINSRLELVTNEASQDEVNIYLYGRVQDSNYWDDENVIVPKEVINMLNSAKASVINLHINSYGGSAFAGIAIHNTIRQHKATVNAYIDGIAASAASVIVMGCDKIYMPKNTMLMIHEASTVAWGKASELRKEADTLEQLNIAVAASYASRFNGTSDELAKMLADDTYLTADKAKEYGLCDEVLEDVEIEDDNEQTDNEPTAKLLREFVASLQANKNNPKLDEKQDNAKEEKKSNNEKARATMDGALAFFDAFSNIKTRGDNN